MSAVIISGGQVLGSSGSVYLVNAATPVFNFADFSGSPSTMSLSQAAAFAGSAITLTSPISGHSSGGAWYRNQVNIQQFTCTGSFTPATSGGYAVGFVIQNTNSLNMPGTGFNGNIASADANCAGYGAGTGQPVVACSIAVIFDYSNANHTSYMGSNGSSIGLFMNGGPNFNAGAYGFLACDSVQAYGVNFPSGDLFTWLAVYDGTNLDFTLTDTVTGATVRKIWPLDIPLCVAGNVAWVGMTGGTPNTASQDFNAFAYWTGYNTRLAAPTLSVPGGSYASTQTVSISASAGATIYYTTDGKVPTSASTAYSGALTISSNTYIQAVAVQSGYTTSYPVTANYLISSASTINFPSGFASLNGLITLNSAAFLNGSDIQLTTNTPGGVAGSSTSAWYNAPVNVNTNWSTTFTLQNNSTSGQGLCFVIQNYLPASLDNVGSLTTNTEFTGNLVVSGGINSVGLSQTGLGYNGILSSVAVKFDIFSGNTTGIYTNGAVPGTGGTTMTGINMTSTTPISVTLSYNSSTHVLSLSVTQGANNYSTTFSIDIPGTVNGSTAIVGFTGSTGGGSQGIQKITSWTGF